MKKHFGIALLLVVGACSSGDELAQALRQEIKQAHGAPFALAKATNFEWERVHVFAPYTPVEEVKRMTGFDLHRSENDQFLEEGIALLVFSSGGVAVSHVELPRKYGDFSGLTNDQGYTREEAVFIVGLIDQGYGQKWPVAQLAVQPAAAPDASRR